MAQPQTVPQSHNRNEIGELRVWTTAVTYIVSRLNIMKKYKGNQGIGHTIVGLAWRRRHIVIINR